MKSEVKDVSDCRGDSGGEAKVFVSGELWRSMQHAQSEPDFPTRDSRLRSLFQSTDANKQTSFIRVKQQVDCHPYYSISGTSRN